MGAFALATISCNKEPTEMVDKTEYNVTILVEGRTIKTQTPSEYQPGSYYIEYNDDYKALKGVTIKLLDYDKTCTTDSDGKATLTLQLGEYRIAVEKDEYGYEQYYTYYPSEPSSGYSDNFSSFGEEKFIGLDVEGNTVEKITLYETPE